MAGAELSIPQILDWTEAGWPIALRRGRDDLIRRLEVRLLNRMLLRLIALRDAGQAGTEAFDNLRRNYSELLSASTIFFDFAVTPLPARHFGVSAFRRFLGGEHE